MKKKIKILILLGLCLVATCLIGASVLAHTTTSTKLAAWGRYLNDKNHDASVADDIYAQGEKTCITTKDIEQVQNFYMLSGKDEKTAWEEAVQYVKEREALYQAAIDNGYSVTDQEVWDYIDELKKTVDSADNKEDALAIIRQFDSEQDYWNYEFSVYQKNLPIQNYVHDIEQTFMQRSASSKKASNEIESEWQQYFEQLKTDLINKENYQIVNK
ncbi:MAG: hypothetical protein IJ711_07810 [Lachnospiraceae bacterium]|nr:hypothetical protein [Lachnospiraceae bacterium]